jgi:poly(3-hydroxybutyrate) depolymerase
MGKWLYSTPFVRANLSSVPEELSKKYSPVQCSTSSSLPSKSKDSLSRNLGEPDDLPSSIHASKHGATILVSILIYKLREDEVKALIKVRRSAILLIILASWTTWIHAQAAKNETLLARPADLQGAPPAHARRAMLSSGGFVSQANIDDLGEHHKPQSVEQSIEVNGVSRTYRLYVPRSYVPGESALIIAFHGRGGGGPGSAMEQFSNLDEKADREGFAVAYLNGLVDATGTLNWNYFYDPFFTTGPDDVGFTREVIDSLQARIHPDRRRIFVTGTSAGGFMAQRAGVELSDRVAAIGVVEGGLFVFAPNSPQAVPPAVAPISVLMLKGDQDPNNQYCGAVFPTFGITEATADQDFEYWTGSSANRCSRVDVHAPLCKSVGVGDANAIVTPGTPSNIVTKEATDCKRDTEVKVYRLLGGLDQWNQQPMNVPGQIPFNPDLDARSGVTTNDILWKFFESHPKREDHF